MAYGYRSFKPPTRWQKFKRALGNFGAIGLIVLFALFVILLISIPFLWYGFIVWAVVKLLGILAAAVGSH